MNILLDHDVPDDLSFLLIELGHNVTFLRQALPTDSPDEAVLEFSYLQRHNRAAERAG